MVAQVEGAAALIPSTIVLGDVDSEFSMVPRTEKGSELEMPARNSGEKGGKKNPAKNTPVQRRASARIQAAKQKAEEEEQARPGAGVVEEEKEKEKSVKVVKKGSKKRVRNGESLVEEDGEVVGGGGSSPKKGNEGSGSDESVEEGDGEGGVGPSLPKKLKGRPMMNDQNGVADSENKGAALRVKETIRVYNKHYLHFVQEEEKRCGKVNAERKAAKQSKSSKSKKGKQVKQPEVKKAHQRPDLKALSKMMASNEILYPEKRIGHLPGIEVGHQFYSRGEMVAVGFHSHWLNGIDYMGKSYEKESSTYEFPVAVAIVLSGQYEDDLDNADDVVYTGQGGHNLTGDKRQIKDQKLERGNLALKNCIAQSVPVRVIRGHNKSSNAATKIYTYDGLYQVVKYWAEKGISGFTVYKFRLKRIEGQPNLTTNQVHFTRGRVPQSTAEIRGLVCEDITGGQENIPIPATNLVDDPPVAPTDFTYCNIVKVAKNVKFPKAAVGCKCKGLCIDSTTCECALRNGSEFPYVAQNGGRLVKAKDVVFECGPNCGCDATCVNRTSQKGIRYRLEVFRTPKKGWAVRSWDFIPAGAPVCEYTGILARTEDMDSVLENNYIFEIDCLQTIKGIGGRERRSESAKFPSNLLDKYEDHGSEGAPEYCIDAGSTGNIARFINHCCEPNLFVQCVLSTHHDLKFARVMLFAADNIPPLQELTYDYGYELDSVLGPDGKIKQVACYCGAPSCRKRLF
ncbi:Histone-lysine N-methyltransferase, H3 lysine-9 specific suvh4 [Stylosanthes scabra]|uniref:Histone-lysine N-methyltransferase, H3 lysine-9 specific suvh4 n=1 Tax=Stylosanthes scabra TaxID=79078 RepID=A0ABU6Q1X7_9FABA|nr:Histone-lysine N-methyltransferase, H3 lysine-9 specific suvh4 [Stylosanthes scabra]